MIRQLLDFIASSVRDGSAPGNGRREWTLIAIAIVAVILVLVVVRAIEG